MNDFLLILGMLAVTYSVRLFPFAYAHRINFPYWLQEALSYVPVAALTAIIAPIILYRDGALTLDISNHYLIASIAAFFVGWYSRHMLATVLTGLAVFILMRIFTG